MPASGSVFYNPSPILFQKYPMKKITGIITAVFLLFVQHVFAQTDTVRIKTSAVCDECKQRIEHDLSFEKGVKSSSMDLHTKEVTVVYNTQKTDPQKIRMAITKIGYDADTLKRADKAFSRLPECCKAPGHQ
jgi:mercuric ion binding protein